MRQPHHADETVTLRHGDALEVLRELDDASVDCCVTSPPYFGLRNYGEPGQYGLEPTPDAYVDVLAGVLAEVRRVLADDGTVWVNIGDSRSGRANAGATFDRHRGHGHHAGIVAPQRNMTAHAPYKSLLGLPERLMLRLIKDRWIVRSRIRWWKPNSTPERVDDRPTDASETVLLLSKRPRYWYDLEAGRDPRTGLHDVWAIPTVKFPAAHFATMPPELARRCVAAGCRPGGTVLDPFSGSGTTGLAAGQLGRRYVGIDLSRAYLDLSLRTRLAQGALVEEQPCGNSVATGSSPVNGATA